MIRRGSSADHLIEPAARFSYQSAIVLASRDLRVSESRAEPSQPERSDDRP